MEWVYLYQSVGCVIACLFLYEKWRGPDSRQSLILGAGILLVLWLPLVIWVVIYKISGKEY